MAATQLFLRTSVVKSSLTGLTGGVHSSLGLTLLKLSPDCTAKPKAQRRHATHFTYHPDPVPTQYGMPLFTLYNGAGRYSYDSSIELSFLNTVHNA